MKELPQYLAYMAILSMPVESEALFNKGAEHQAGKIPQWSVENNSIVESHGDYPAMESLHQVPVGIRFEFLRDLWRQDIGRDSSLTNITKNKYYSQIIELKTPVVPYILKELQVRPGPWFFALRSIIKDDSPKIPNEYIGNFKKMSEVWVEWGKHRGMI